MGRKKNGYSVRNTCIFLRSKFLGLLCYTYLFFWGVFSLPELITFITVSISFNVSCWQCGISHLLMSLSEIHCQSSAIHQTHNQRFHEPVCEQPKGSSLQHLKTYSHLHYVWWTLQQRILISSNYTVHHGCLFNCWIIVTLELFNYFSHSMTFTHSSRVRHFCFDLDIVMCNMHNAREVILLIIVLVSIPIKPCLLILINSYHFNFVDGSERSNTSWRNNRIYRDALYYGLAMIAIKCSMHYKLGLKSRNKGDH